MGKIFISYCHKDEEFAFELNRGLQSANISTWIDEAELVIGDPLRSRIKEAIKGCRYVGVLLSPDSVNSEWVRYELEFSLIQENAGEVIVIPIVCKKVELPDNICNKAIIDFTEEFKDGLENLKNTIAKFDEILEINKMLTENKQKIEGKESEKEMIFRKPIEYFLFTTVSISAFFMVALYNYNYLENEYPFAIINECLLFILMFLSIINNLMILYNVKKILFKSPTGILIILFMSIITYAFSWILYPFIFFALFITSLFQLLKIGTLKKNINELKREIQRQEIIISEFSSLRKYVSSSLNGQNTNIL